MWKYLNETQYGIVYNVIMSLNLDAIIVVDYCQTNRLKDKCLQSNFDTERVQTKTPVL